MRRNGGRGFTIVELVVVIAVVAILTAVMIPTFAGAIRNAREAADKQTMSALNKMLLVGELDAEEIKQYKLKNAEWKLAYSFEKNEAVIVDKSGKIVAANDAKFVGTEIGEGYIIASEIGKEDGGDKPDNPDESDNPSGDDKPDNPIIGPNDEEKGNWDKAERVESELSEISSDKYAKTKELYIDDNVGSMPASYFKEKVNLERVYIGERITKIPERAFDGCISLREVYIAGEGIEIESDAFYSCTALEKINLDKVKRIGLRAFIGCTSLTNIKLNSLESMDEYAFKGCGVNEIELPESLNEMSIDSISKCSLNKLTIKSGMEVGKIGSEVDFTVKELVIGSEERIQVSESLWIYLSKVVDKSKETLTKVTIKNIEIGDSLRDTKPFLQLMKTAQIIIEDNDSYISLLGGRSESEVFGCDGSNIIKRWL